MRGRIGGEGLAGKGRRVELGGYCPLEEGNGGFPQALRHFLSAILLPPSPGIQTPSDFPLLRSLWPRSISAGIWSSLGPARSSDHCPISSASHPLRCAMKGGSKE